MTRTEQASVIRLSHSDGNVMVEPEDEDRFIMTAQGAVEACIDHKRRQAAVLAFKQDFLRPLVKWCMDRQEQVSACYVPFPVGHVQVFVVTTSPRYNFGLGKELAALELKLADDGWRVNVLQLPSSTAEELSTFFNAEGALEVYAQLPTAPGQG